MTTSPNNPENLSKSNSGGEINDELQNQLDHLVNSQLINLSKEIPEMEYMFRHALVQDAVYSSLLNKHRVVMHRLTGETLENNYGDRLEEFASVLGLHFKYAEDDEKALKYFTLAGDAAFRGYANEEAADHFNEALQIAISIPKSNDEIKTLFLKGGRSLEKLGRYSEVLEHYSKLEEFGKENNEQSLVLASLIAQTTIYSTLTDHHNPEKAQALSDQALVLAENMEDFEAQAKIYWNLMNLSFFSGVGEAKVIVDYGKKSIQVAREHNLKEQLAYSLNDISRPHIFDGNMEECFLALEEARQLWTELNNLSMLVDNIGTTIEIYHLVSEYEIGVEMYWEGIEIADQIGTNWGKAYLCSSTALSFYQLGLYEKSIELLEDSIPLAKEANFGWPLWFSRVFLAIIYARFGDIKKAKMFFNDIEQLNEYGDPMLPTNALEIYLNTYSEPNQKADIDSKIVMDDISKPLVDPVSKLLMIELFTEVMLKEEKYQEVLDIVDKSLNRDNFMGIDVNFTQVWINQADAYLGIGEIEKSKDILVKAKNLAEKHKARHNLLGVYARLYQMEKESNNKSEADKYLIKGKKVIAEILESMQDKSLISNFKDQRWVRVLLDAEKSV